MFVSDVAGRDFMRGAVVYTELNLLELREAE